MIRKFALAMMSALLLAAQGERGPFTIEGSGRSFASLQDAVDAIGAGQATIRIAPGRYRQCAVQEAGRVAFVAETPGTATFDGVICEGKAVLVLRGQAARVEGLVFTHMQVDDGNGAGIRIEQGQLEVSQTIFVDGQCGILSAADENGTIAIDRSTFSRLGKHPDGNGAHALYVGHYGAVRVTNSRFERGTGGHYLKSRAMRVEIVGNSFDDSQGHETNYMIDLPEGSVGRIAGNFFVQGLGKENYGTLIAVHAEEGDHPSAGLVIEDNVASVAPGFPWTTVFVGDWSGEPLVIRNNRLGPRITPFERR
ncbi:MAG TPA: right-handed parallel beta-helix repeat-containing protein [Allosphingosinicella sp.]|nr:right-handed parallel beta-helix repeat-containing protein [Allosphingosinicella sp.]